MGALPATMGRARGCALHYPPRVFEMLPGATTCCSRCSQACAATRDVQHCCQFALAGTRRIRHCLLTLPHAHACSHHVVLSGPVMSARKKYNINYPVLYATEADCKNEVRCLHPCLHTCERACGVMGRTRWFLACISHLIEGTHTRCAHLPPTLLLLSLLCVVCVQEHRNRYNCVQRGHQVGKSVGTFRATRRRVWAGAGGPRGWAECGVWVITEGSSGGAQCGAWEGPGRATRRVILLGTDCASCSSRMILHVHSNLVALDTVAAGCIETAPAAAFASPSERRGMMRF